MSERLRGRERDAAILDALTHDARSGRSRVLVLRGEAGVGKTALLDQLACNATGFSLLRLAGVESDMELAFAGLQLATTQRFQLVAGFTPMQAGILVSLAAIGSLPTAMLGRRWNVADRCRFDCV